MKLFHVTRDSFLNSGVVASAIICAETHEEATRYWPKIDCQMQLEVVEIAPAAVGQLPGVLMTSQFWGNKQIGCLATRYPDNKKFIVEMERIEKTKTKVTPWEDHKGPHPDFVNYGVDPQTLSPSF